MEHLWTETSTDEILSVGLAIFFRYIACAGLIIIGLIAIARINAPKSLTFLRKLKIMASQRKFRSILLVFNIIAAIIIGTITFPFTIGPITCIISGALSGSFVYMLSLAVIRFLDKYLDKDN